MESKKLREFVEEGRIVRCGSEKDYYVIPEQGRPLEALLVAEEISDRFNGAFCGTEEVFVREYAGEGVYGPFVSLPCAKVAVLDVDGLDEFLKVENPVIREVFSFPLKKGVFTVNGATVSTATLTIDWEKAPQVLSKSFSGDVAGEIDIVLERVCKLFPDGLSALSFTGSWYCLGRCAAYRVEVINLCEKMMVVVEGKAYTQEMSVCKNHCNLYGFQCMTCAFGAGLGGCLW